MIPFTLAQVAAAVSGELVGGPAAAGVTVRGVTVDSRAVQPGDLFVAMSGERVDGHDYVDAAVAAGAAAVLSERPTSAPGVVVPDVLAAVGGLARELLTRLDDVTVIALTGSSGKTSTKDILGQVLSVAGPTIAPQGSFNNELGLPLTVLRCDAGTGYLVLEMGARGLGHIAYLTAIAPPQVGLVLNVGTAHVGEFGGQRAIARAKGELVADLTPDALAVLNADDPLVRTMSTPARVLTFGAAPDADVRLGEVQLDDLARPRFELSYGGAQAQVQLQLSGEHMASNAAAAAAVALGLGMDLDEVAAALSAAQPQSRWRMELHHSPEGVVIVNDAYNANPESMRAALKSLAAMAPEPPGRTWAVLGEMKELGAESLRAHDEIGRLAVRLDISRLIVVGEGARAMHLGAAQEGSWGDETTWVPDADAALAIVREQVRPGDVVLVKASRALGLERIADALVSGAS